MALNGVELFLRLAKLPYHTGHRYWAYRFSAWAMHYVQDLCQIYHSKAVPHAGFGYYVNFIFSFGIFGDSKADIKRKTTTIVGNRHFIYEDFVAYSLQESYTTANDTNTALRGYLNQGENRLNARDSISLVAAVTDFAADHSGKMDATLIEVFGKNITDNPEYDLEKDPNYSIKEQLSKMNQEKSKLLLQETGLDFRMTGKASRTLIHLVDGK